MELAKDSIEKEEGRRGHQKSPDITFDLHNQLGMRTEIQSSSPGNNFAEHEGTLQL